MRRPRRFAGRYYFPDAGRLRAAVESYIEDATVPRVQGTLVGIVVPHSQMSEIGPVAGVAYKLLVTAPLTWNRVLMLAPTANDSRSLVCDPCDAYDTPLEPLPIDRDGIDALREAGVAIADADDAEPIVECHAPFVEVALGEMPVMPVRVPERVAFGQWVAPLASHADLLIVCANLPPDYEQPAREAIVRMDASFFDGITDSAKAEIFGRKPSKPARAPDVTTLALALAIAKAKGATKAQVLKIAGVFGAFALLK